MSAHETLPTLLLKKRKNVSLSLCFFPLNISAIQIGKILKIKTIQKG